MQTRPFLTILLLTAFVLAAFSTRFDLSRIHASGFNNYLNDQIEYVSVARNWSETGRLESSIVYPSAIEHGEYRHLPGHAVLIAIAYSIFGDTTLSYLLPSLLAALLIPALTFSIASKVYDRRTGWLSALFTMMFAPFIVFSFTAMPETTFVVAGLAGLSLLLAAGSRVRALLVVPTLLLPFLFRETGAFLIFPFIVVATTVKRRMVAIFATSTLIITGVYSLIVAPGSGALFKANLVGASERIKYGDAVFASSPLSVHELFMGCVRNASEQLTVLADGFSRAPSSLQYASLLLVLLATIAVLSVSIRRRDRFGIGVGMTSLVLWFFLIALYQVDAFVGMRMTLFLVPFLAIAAFGLVRGKVATRVATVITSLLVLGQIHFVLLVAPELSRNDEFDDRAIAFIEATEHDPGKLLVAPLRLAQAYALKRHPARISLQPSNVETLALLMKRYEIGSLIYSESQLSDGLTTEDLKRIGFVDQKSRQFDGADYVLLRK